ncbi:hypothetical protein ACFFX0_17590 [Citricoccus parietis]|uniref:Uncharacterized protein n=1 Tax=Citricoccus parietis TaxID=592307 RepID=A0ABV5G1V2_9MICC
MCCPRSRIQRRVWAPACPRPWRAVRTSRPRTPMPSSSGPPVSTADSWGTGPASTRPVSGTVSTSRPTGVRTSPCRWRNWRH